MLWPGMSNAHRSSSYPQSGKYTGDVRRRPRSRSELLTNGQPHVHQLTANRPSLHRRTRSAIPQSLSLDTGIAMNNGLWGIKELAEYLGIPQRTLYQWRTKGYGPPGLRIGKYVKYLPSDVERWIKEQGTT